MATFIRVTITTITFTANANTFLNEHQNRWYSTGVFYIAQTIVDLIPTLIEATVCALLSFYMNGPFNETDRLMSYVQTFILGMISAQSLGYVSGAMFVRREVLAMEVSIVLFMVNIMFSNAFMRIDDLPQWLQPLVSTDDQNIKSRQRFEAIKDQKNGFLRNKLCIAWTDLTLKVSGNWFTDEKVILNGINGYFEFGSLNALMGPSGAGKTTLLKCIFGRNRAKLSDETRIYLSKSKRIRTCFVSQDVSEHLLNGLTAKEALIYASKLKNTYDDIDHELHVTKLMNDLLISDIADNYCEDCSGGQQKRLVLAMELTANIMPNLICIDEPTSGLDSNSSEVVIECLKYISRKHNIAIVTSIHQPNSDILVLFDKLYVLCKGGKCVYSGRPQDLETHLNGCGITVNEYQVAIEVIIKLSSNDYLCDEQVMRLLDKTSQQKETIAVRCKDETNYYPKGINKISKRFNFIDFRTLVSRTWLYISRFYWKILLVELAFVTFIAVCLKLNQMPQMIEGNGCISFDDDFANQCNKTDAKLEEERLQTQNIIYHLLIFIFFSWYSTGTYYWTKTLADLAPTLIIVTIYAYLTEAYNNDQLLPLVVILTIVSIVLQSTGHLIAVLFSGTPTLAALIACYCFVAQLLFSNFFIFTKNLHYSLQLVSNLSVMKLAFESTVVWIYGFDVCTDREFSSPLYLIFTIHCN
ncbi:unnamed protein product [Oppiella nova]|uniref:ABC transporter domain-containing protein n=1 Tax=Oppiella nova TaxID=334625 RepID=A0A7R9LQL1_9ACAR|nr:unnamed protein product [Oppiella nova]CAG2165982.1 unnamed protein product [Oppiella nova]